MGYNYKINHLTIEVLIWGRVHAREERNKFRKLGENPVGGSPKIADNITATTPEAAPEARLFLQTSRETVQVQIKAEIATFPIYVKKQNLWLVGNKEGAKEGNIIKFLTKFFPATPLWWWIELTIHRPQNQLERGDPGPYSSTCIIMQTNRRSWISL